MGRFSKILMLAAKKEYSSLKKKLILFIISTLNFNDLSINIKFVFLLKIIFWYSIYNN